MALITFPSQPDAPVTPFSSFFPGQLVESASATIPAGFLACDGSAVSRTTYSALFAAIGVVWGAGDTTTTFNVPDLRGRATIGSGTGPSLTARTLGQQAIGEELHVLTVAELAAHNHTISDPGHTHAHNATAVSGGVGGGAGGGGIPTSYVGATISAAVTGITIVNNGSSSGHNNMQPSAVVTKLIKT